MPQTPDIRPLLVRDLTAYFLGKGFDQAEAELMAVVDQECDKLERFT
jgi:hypothetical protein